jgi:hypothetical protein
MKKAIKKKLSLHRETLQALEEGTTLKNAAGGNCSKVGTSCGSCVRTCTFTRPPICP